MKKILLISIILIFTALNSVEIKWSAALGWYPIAMGETNENATGVSVDIMEEMEKRLNITAVRKLELPWKRKIIELEKGSLDLVIGIYKNKEREEKFYFTTDFMKNETRIFVKKDNKFPFNKLEDLKGKSYISPAGGKFGDEFEKFAKTNLDKQEVYSEKENQMLMLLNDRADFWISDFYDVTHYLKQQNKQNEIVPLDKPVNTVNVYAVISKKSPIFPMADKINSTLESMKKDGTLDRILKKYQ